MGTLKYDYDFVKDFFENKGCKLITAQIDYKGVESRLEYECVCGEKVNTTFVSYRRNKHHVCKRCVHAIIGKKVSKSIRNTQEFIEKVFEEHGCKLLDEYQYNDVPVRFLCSCGEEGIKSFSNFKKGSYCKECGVKKAKDKKTKSRESIKKSLSELGCELVDTYHAENRKRIIKYICPNGHEAEQYYDVVVANKGRCWDCAKEALSGENHYNWKGGYEYEYVKFRKSYEFKKWRKDVLDRDNYTCQCCTKHYEELSPLSYLVAHHLDGYNWCIERRTDLDNGITLCRKCHDSFHDVYGRGDNTKEQYNKFIEIYRKVLI